MASRDGERKRATNRDLFRKRDFRLLLTGLAISCAGDWLYGVALIVFVYEETHSAAWVGATTIVRLVPYILFGALGGVLADRYEKRKVMVLSDLTRAALMFGLGIAAALSAPASVALAFAFCATVAGTPFGPALGAMLPKVVDEDELAAANALTSTVEHVALIVGPAIGALLLLLGSAAAAFAANGLTFLLSALATSRVKTRMLATSSESEEIQGIRQRLAEGIAGIRASGAASLIVLLLIAAAGLYGFELVFTVLLAEGPLNMGAEGVGWLSTAVGVGGTIAAVVTGRVASSRRSDIVLLASVALMGLPFVFLAGTEIVFLALLLMGMVGVGNIIFDVVAMTILQRVVAENLLARVLGILDSLAVAAMLVGSILAPLLVQVFSLTTALVVVGTVLPAGCLLSIPRLRSLRGAANRSMDELAPLVTLLERSGAFEGAGRTTLEGLAVAATRQEIHAGDVLIRQGDAADDFFVVEEGTFRVTSRGESGSEDVEVNQLARDDYFGEIGLLENVQRTATVAATSDGVVYRISGQDFLDHLNQTTAPPAMLLSSVATRLSRTHPSLTPSTAGGADA
jgi:MFS family permease